MYILDIEDSLNIFIKEVLFLFSAVLDFLTLPENFGLMFGVLSFRSDLFLGFEPCYNFWMLFLKSNNFYTFLKITHKQYFLDKKALNSQNSYSKSTFPTTFFLSVDLSLRWRSEVTPKWAGGFPQDQQRATTEIPNQNQKPNPTTNRPPCLITLFSQIGF